MATKRLNPFGAALLGGLLLLWPQTSRADEPQHLRQSVRALGMGNAFVAAVNDENSLYYNPAGLASVQRSFFELLSVTVTANQNLIDLGQTDSADQTAAVGNLVGNKIYAEEGLGLLSFTAPYWGWSFYQNAVFDAQVHNPTIPYFEALVYGQVTAISGADRGLVDLLAVDNTARKTNQARLAALSAQGGITLNSAHCPHELARDTQAHE